METKKLGSTHLEISPLGFGVLTIGPLQRQLPIEEGADLIVYAAGRGIRFFDTAQYYRTYPYLRAALDTMRAQHLSLPVIASKSLCTDKAGMKEAIDEALSELALPSLDIFLLHEVWGREDFYHREGAWQALCEARESGLLRAIGISTHHVDAAREMADIPECDVVFPLCNVESLGIRDGESPGTKEDMEAAIAACHAAGKGVFTMKAFGGGNLTKDYVRCLDYASNIPGNDAVMIGLSSREEIDRAVDYFEGRLSPSYAPDVSGKRMLVEEGECIGCGACIKRCASHAISWGKNGLASIDPKKCLRCGYCAPVCPMRAIILL